MYPSIDAFLNDFNQACDVAVYSITSDEYWHMMLTNVCKITETIVTERHIKREYRIKLMHYGRHDNFVMTLIVTSITGGKLPSYKMHLEENPAETFCFLL